MYGLIVVPGIGLALVAWENNHIFFYDESSMTCTSHGPEVIDARALVMAASCARSLPSVLYYSVHMYIFNWT